MNDEIFWRGFDERLGTPERDIGARPEFPAGVEQRPGEMTRRAFVELVGASIALAGLSGCVRRPREKILPYVRQPSELTPGEAQHYATAMTVGGYATGLLVRSNAGRPTKVEGNPEHPASLGAAGVYEQASVLQLYDPQRARTARAGGAPAGWAGFARVVNPAELGRRVGARGAGLQVLLEPSGSPLLAEMVGRLLTRYPEAGIHFDAPLAAPGLDQWALAAFGRAVRPQHDFRQADVVLALDADFLSSMPFHLRYAHDFAERRRIRSPGDDMNRLYVAEPMPTPTGDLADHRLRAPARQVEPLLAAIAAEVVLGSRRPAGMPPPVEARLRRARDDSPPSAWVRAVAADLGRAAGRSVVIAGERQPAGVHALAHLLNLGLGNVGRTVRYAPSPLLDGGHPARGLGPLVDAMRAGEVEALFVLEGNPAYTAPADVEFARWLGSVPLTAYLGLYRNETARGCRWFLPALHYLESWGDARAYDGTVSLVQPLIAPLYGGRSPVEVLAALNGAPDTRAHGLLREFWHGPAAPRPDIDWDAALRRGLLPGSGTPALTTAPRWDALAPLLAVGPPAAAAEGGLEVVFLQDAKVYDGCFANNAWLQELPEPSTKLTWDNAALMSPATAARAGLETGDVVDLEYRGRRLRIPALVVPGAADESVGLRLGYGRAGEDERVARAVGVNAYRIRTAAAPYFGAGLRAGRPAGGDELGRHRLARTQTHWSLEGRPIVLRATLEEFRRRPHFTDDQSGRQPSLYRPAPDGGDQWAMVIDLAACTGCSACVVACQAENNIPVVGREGVLDGREMHWLRLDRYYTGSAADPDVVTQPMLCQHCEKAPCEYVCPVGATSHSPDGLNEMTYNRCVGTRFCSNNCPYKVRRFNWFDYNAEVAETERMVKNPQVTVRARGVMEKCTFCVQRIRTAQIAAEVGGRALRTGEVRTACQQACPTQAIAFGSYNDPEDEVVRRRASPRLYSVLHELGTRPRVQYLARITNPNPALERGGM